MHGADVHDSRLGFWMDFVDGAHVERGHPAVAVRAAPARRLAWGQDLCRALAAVHADGIVHRNVKAQNVMRQHAATGGWS